MGIGRKIVANGCFSLVAVCLVFAEPSHKSEQEAFVELISPCVNAFSEGLKLSGDTAATAAEEQVCSGLKKGEKPEDVLRIGKGDAMNIISFKQGLSFYLIEGYVPSVVSMDAIPYALEAVDLKTMEPIFKDFDHESLIPGAIKLRKSFFRTFPEMRGGDTRFEAKNLMAVILFNQYLGDFLKYEVALSNSDFVEIAKAMGAANGMMQTLKDRPMDKLGRDEKDALQILPLAEEAFSQALRQAWSEDATMFDPSMIPIIAEVTGAVNSLTEAASANPAEFAKSYLVEGAPLPALLGRIDLAQFNPNAVKSTGELPAGDTVLVPFLVSSLTDAEGARKVGVGEKGNKVESAIAVISKYLPMLTRYNRFAKGQTPVRAEMVEVLIGLKRLRSSVGDKPAW